MTARDIDLARHRVDSLVRAATRTRTHLADLHTLAFEAHHTDTEVHVRQSKTDHTPRGGDPQAHRLWERALTEIGRCEDILVGLERLVTAHFYAHSQSPEPSRGSLISRIEHDQLLSAQRARAAAGDYVPARLGDQPPHPGRRP